MIEHGRLQRFTRQCGSTVPSVEVAAERAEELDEAVALLLSGHLGQTLALALPVQGQIYLHEIPVGIYRETSRVDDTLGLETSKQRVGLGGGTAGGQWYGW